MEESDTYLMILDEGQEKGQPGDHPDPGRRPTRAARRIRESRSAEHHGFGPAQADRTPDPAKRPAGRTSLTPLEKDHVVRHARCVFSYPSNLVSIGAQPENAPADPRSRRRAVSCRAALQRDDQTVTDHRGGIGESGQDASLRQVGVGAEYLLGWLPSRQLLQQQFDGDARVPAMTGLPIMTLGSETINGSGIRYLPDPVNVNREADPLQRYRYFPRPSLTQGVAPRRRWPDSLRYEERGHRELRVRNSRCPLAVFPFFGGPDAKEPLPL